ncbi:hypothetical protein [Streptomyces chartreusis]
MQSTTSQSRSALTVAGEVGGLPYGHQFAMQRMVFGTQRAMQVELE